MVEERVGEAYELGEQLTVLGHKLAPGDKAPDFVLENFDPATGTMRSVKLSDSAGKVRLLNIVNSLDTPVCHVETNQWEKKGQEFAPEVEIFTVSMDLPFAMARWQTAEGVKHQMLSAHKNEDFGKDYGVLIKEWRMLQRVVLVIDSEDRIVHAEYVPDQMAEPDYDAALNAAAQIKT